MMAGFGRGRAGAAIGSAVVAAGMALASPPAWADLLDQFIAPDVPGTGVQRDVTVLSRQRPQYDPLGVRLGDFTIRPQLTESVGYDDNATGTRTPHGSALVETNADLVAVYDHSRMRAAAELTVDDYEYLQQPQQSYTNWTASLSGSHDVGRDTVSFAYTHQNLNQTVQSLDVPQLNAALAYRIDQVHVAYRVDLAPMFVLPALTIARFSYDNGTAGGILYQQTYRNHIVYNPTVTTGYQLGRTSLVVVLRNAEADYTDRPAGTPTRDFSDFSLLAGIDYEATGFLRYRLLAGYEARFFTSAAYRTIAAPIIEASAIWNPTGLTTVTLEAARRIEDSADEATVGLTESAVALRVDHELYRNVLLRVSTAYTDDQYSQNQGTQALYTAGVGATYLLNRSMRLTAGYDFTARRSSGTATLGTTAQSFGPGYNDNRILLQLRLAL